MKRNVNLDEISDGKLYKVNDMVKADCHGCAGCHLCCTGMGQSVILDPYDVYRLTNGVEKPFAELLECGKLELNVVDGYILPNLVMKGQEEACGFLSSEGRCEIHDSRPAICRLFPLGRIYGDSDYSYFLQTNECPKQNKTKVKISKWIDTPCYDKYHNFIMDWHRILKQVEALVAGREDSAVAKSINMLLLQCFYMTAYSEADFYIQFAQRQELFVAQIERLQLEK